MSSDPRVQELIEAVLESGISAELVCRDCPELLPEVLDGCRRFQTIKAQVVALFPSPGSIVDHRTTAPEIGPPLIPGYEVLEVLGRGGVGIVYKALHIRLNRIVALKMLLAGALASSAERKRFSREAEVVAKLRHPNIVQVYDVGELDGRPYFTMEFVEGGSLAELIAGTPRPARQAAEVMATLADAMDAAHLGGIVHRDLKPSNVLLTRDGTPKIGDFGLARTLEVGPLLTQSGAAVGTPSYMAPEQAHGKSSQAGPAADIYALGAVLYELVTGRPPFRAESAAETLHQVITREPVPPSRLNAKVSRDLETICLKCLRKEPQSRYLKTAALADDLRRYLRGDTISARPENILQRTSRRVRRRPFFWAAVATGTLLALTLACGGLWLYVEWTGATWNMAAERAARERASEDDLREMVRCERKASWADARAALARASARLDRQGSAEIRRRLAQGASELNLVAKLDAIQMQRAVSVGGVFDASKTDQKYEAAFIAAELGRVYDRPEDVSTRVNASNIREALVDAIDDWASLITEPRRRDWLLAVVRQADLQTTRWRELARDPATWRSEAALARVIEEAPFGDNCVPLLLATERHWTDLGKDPIPFLKKVQQAHRGDFMVNFRLGDVSLQARQFAEAVRYYQAALIIRPEAGVTYNNLGIALGSLGRKEEALVQYREALTLDPTATGVYHNMALALKDLGRLDEAIELSRAALRIDPNSAIHYRDLGLILSSQGQIDEAVTEVRKAVALEPQDVLSLQDLRVLLIRGGRADEARVVWEKTLATDPPLHGTWYGYAEYCLFLGLEDEYRRNRQALLAKFGNSTDPYLAERTARACLLRPTSGEELRRIVTLGERAWSIDRTRYSRVYAYFLFLRGLAEYRQGQFDRAIDTMRGEAAGALAPAPDLVRAMALKRSGRAAEATRHFEAAIAKHDWRAEKIQDQDDWIRHVLRREAEALIRSSASQP